MRHFMQHAWRTQQPLTSTSTSYQKEDVGGLNYIPNNQQFEPYHDQQIVGGEGTTSYLPPPPSYDLEHSCE